MGKSQVTECKRTALDKVSRDVLFNSCNLSNMEILNNNQGLLACGFLTCCQKPRHI